MNIKHPITGCVHSAVNIREGKPELPKDIFIVPNKLLRKPDDQKRRISIECTDSNWLPPSANKKGEQMTIKDCVVIHHSYGEPDQLTKYESTMDEAFDWQSLRKFHIEDRHFHDVGYPFGIAPNGKLLIGRPAQIDGAHCLGHNTYTIGVCLLGNFSKHHVPLIQWTLAIQFVSTLCMLYNIKPTRVLGHREMPDTATECPGKKFDMRQFRAHLVSHTRMMTSNG